MADGKISDEDGPRLAFAAAARAREHGNHPFGAVLVDRLGKVLLEAENGYMPDRDMTAHAERLLATAASRRYRPAEFFISPMGRDRPPKRQRRRAGEGLGLIETHLPPHPYPLPQGERESGCDSLPLQTSA